MYSTLVKELRHNRVLWLLVFVPAALVAARLRPEAHTLLFVLSVLAIVPLAVLLSQATHAVADKTGDATGGLLNATLGNLTELVIALTALRAGAHRRQRGTLGVVRRRAGLKHISRLRDRLISVASQSSLSADGTPPSVTTSKGSIGRAQ
jgi:hypothetical protein